MIGCRKAGKNSIGKIVPTTKIALEYNQNNGEASSIKKENKPNAVINKILMMVAKRQDSKTPITFTKDRAGILFK